MDLVVVAAFGLLVLGVVASVLPVLPSGAVSMAGVLLFWWHTGQPGPVVLAALLLTGLLALVVDWAAGFIGARAGGASVRTSALATAVGLALFALAGPVGLLVGISGTVFAVEISRGAGKEASLRAAGAAVVGVLGSALVQALLTGAVLLAMVVVYL
ncbi:MAG: DUF456 domain-containing protein [Halolamina sp.]